MSHICAYNSHNGSRPYNPLRIDAMMNPEKYGMSSYSDTQLNNMLGASAERIYYSNTNCSANSSSSKSSRSSSGGLKIRSGEFWSYGLWH